MLKFSKENAKLRKLRDIPELQRFLTDKRKIYSFDLLSGHSCPFAEKCLSKAVVQDDGKRKIVDGEKTEFRCFSASQEVQYTNVYNSRSGNFENLRQKKSGEIGSLILDAMPENLGICRIHVAGDFFSPAYFAAWVEVARHNPDRLFYAYTKSLPYWVNYRSVMPENFVLTASRGGRCDDMIDEHGLRESVVVFSEQEAADLGYTIDHDDSHAAVPEWRDNSFALLIHGTQPKGSNASEALKELRKNKVDFSYSR
jgi:hypothetical protein